MYGRRVDHRAESGIVSLLGGSRREGQQVELGEESVRIQSKARLEDYSLVLFSSSVAFFEAVSEILSYLLDISCAAYSYVREH